MRTSQLSSAPRSCASAPSAPSSWDKGPSCPPPLRSTARPASPQVSPCARAALSARCTLALCSFSLVEMLLKCSPNRPHLRLPATSHLRHTRLFEWIQGKGCHRRSRSTGCCHWPGRCVGIAEGSQRAGYSRMGMSAFSSPVSQLPVRPFSLSVVNKAPVIMFCYFTLPHTGQHSVTFTSPTCTRVHTGLSMAQGGLHSAPVDSAADKVVITQSGNGTFWR